MISARIRVNPQLWGKLEDGGRLVTATPSSYECFLFLGMRACIFASHSRFSTTNWQVPMHKFGDG